MQRIPTFFGLAIAVSLAACKGDALDAANKYADELCACTNVECVEKVTKKHEARFDEKALAKLREDSPEAVDELGARIMECTAKHLPSATPPAED